MNLGDLIKFLKGVDPNKVCRFGFNHPHSYRGYYEDLAFEPAENITVGEMLAAAESALSGEFTGYKGGHYVMHEYTDCWIANYGDGGGEGIGPMLLRYMTEDAKPNHISQPVKMVSEREQKASVIAMDLLRNLSALITLADEGSVIEKEPTHYIPLVYDGARAARDTARAALSPQPGGTGEE